MVIVKFVVAAWSSCLADLNLGPYLTEILAACQLTVPADQHCARCWCTLLIAAVC